MGLFARTSGGIGGFRAEFLALSPTCCFRRWSGTTSEGSDWQLAGNLALLSHHHFLETYGSVDARAIGSERHLGPRKVLHSVATLRPGTRSAGPLTPRLPPEPLEVARPDAARPHRAGDRWARTELRSSRGKGRTRSAKGHRSTGHSGARRSRLHLTRPAHWSLGKGVGCATRRWAEGSSDHPGGTGRAGSIAHLSTHRSSGWDVLAGAGLTPCQPCSLPSPRPFSG